MQLFFIIWYKLKLGQQNSQPDKLNLTAPETEMLRWLVLVGLLIFFRTDLVGLAIFRTDLMLEKL